MGCFSFMCVNSGMDVQDNDVVHLFLIKDGKVIEHMYGRYDNYGRVYDESGFEPYEWFMDWKDVCSLMFDGSGDGIAAILDYHFDGRLPISQSDSDPNQGWGSEDDDTVIRKRYTKMKGKPFHRDNTQEIRDEKIKQILDEDI